MRAIETIVQGSAAFGGNERHRRPRQESVQFNAGLRRTTGTAEDTLDLLSAALENQFAGLVAVEDDAAQRGARLVER